MKNRILFGGLVSLIAASVLIVGVAAYAQDTGNQGEERDAARERRPGGNFRNMTPEDRQKRMEEFRKRMDERLREQLGFTAEEWEVVQPRYEKVIELQRELATAGRMGRFGPMRPGGRGGRRDRRGGPEGEQEQPEQSELAKAHTALQKAVTDKDSTDDQVKKALEAYRAAKAKVAKDLEAARASLKELLTPRQEAQLVSRGVLE